MIGWPRFMKPGTLAAFLDVSESTVRDLERRGVIPQRHPVIGGFDAEAVVNALARAAGGRTDAEEAKIRTIEDISGQARSGRRNRA